MSRSPCVSVVVVTRNRLEPLAETLRALRDQTLPASEYEVIVVDDGSTPAVQLPSAQERVNSRLVRLEGRERSAARNAGAKAAGDGLLVFVDDDITIGAGFLEAHFSAHQERANSLVVGAIYLPAEASVRPFGRFRQALERQGIPSQGGVTSARNFCTAANMSITRQWFFVLGGFDETLLSAEDQDLALRHSEIGGSIVFLPEAAGTHRDEAMDVRRYSRRAEWGSEQLVAFCRKHPAWPDNVIREQVNGPIRWGHEPLAQSARKVAKKLAACPPALQMLFGVTAIVERVAPESPALERMYRALLGVHIYRGYRRGATRWTDSGTPAGTAFNPRLG